MQHLILQQLKNELVSGSIKRGHPFKYFTIGTLYAEKPFLRTVVLRKVHPDLKLVFYTDKRSKKIIQILANQNISALFFHPKKMMQILMEGEANIISSPEVLAKIWSDIPHNSKKDYTTKSAPGSEISHPDEVGYLSQDNHFCMVEITPRRIEYLRLKRQNHLRVEYFWKGDDWKGRFLVP